MNEKYWPASYSGLPLLFMSAGIGMMLVSLLMNVSGYAIELTLPTTMIGIVLVLISTGKSVKICSNGIKLEYGFPFTIIKYNIDDIVEIADITMLEKGQLIRYFKPFAIIFTLYTAFPIAYITVKEKIVLPIAIPYILIPLFIGIMLSIYFVSTASNFRQYVRKLGYVLATIYIIAAIETGYWFREIYGKSISQEPVLLIFTFIGFTLSWVALFTILYFASKRHVILIRDVTGRTFAIIARDSVSARELIGRIAKEVLQR